MKYPKFKGYCRLAVGTTIRKGDNMRNLDYERSAATEALDGESG